LLQERVMNTLNQSHPRAGVQPDPLASARRLTVFAGLVIIVAGVWHILQGVAALVHDPRYASPSNYVYKFQLTGWSWIYLVIGAVVLAVGIAVLAGQVWGRVVAILLAMLSMAVNFVFLPWYPLWSMLMIALNVVIIWTMAMYQRRWNDAATQPP
jgi:hypothetical protein